MRLYPDRVTFDADMEFIRACTCMLHKEFDQKILSLLFDL